MANPIALEKIFKDNESWLMRFLLAPHAAIPLLTASNFRTDLPIFG